MNNLFRLLTILLLLLSVNCSAVLPTNDNKGNNSNASEKNKKKDRKDRNQDANTSDSNASNDTAKSNKTTNSKAGAVAEAVDILLNRQQTNKDQQATALKLVRSMLAVKELRNTRNKRNDPQLLNQHYPKGLSLSIDNGAAIYWTEYDRLHFAARHLMDYCDSSDIKGRNSWWPAGTTREDVDKYLQSAITANRNKLFLPNEGKNGPGFKYFTVDLPNSGGIKVDIGITSEGRVTSFFPRSGPDVISLSENEVKELFDMVGK